LVGDARNVWLGILVSTAMVVSVVIAPVAGFLGEINWRLPFAIYLLTIPLGIICLFVRDARNAEAQAEEQAGVRVIHFRFLVLAFIVGLIGFAPTMYVPFHFIEIGIKDPRLVSTGLMTSTLVGAFSSSQYGRMRRHLDIYQSISIGFTGAALGMGIAALSSTLFGALAGMFVFGAGLAWLSPNLFALVGMLPDRERSATFGMVKGTMYVSTIVGVVVLEPVNRAFGANGVLIAIGASSLAMMSYILINRAQYSERSDPASSGALAAAGSHAE
jgi:hypothetical protein